MCSEAHGVSGWPRKAARFVALVTALTLAAGALAGSLDLSARGSEPARAVVPPVARI